MKVTIDLHLVLRLSTSGTTSTSPVCFLGMYMYKFTIFICFTFCRTAAYIFGRVHWVLELFALISSFRVSLCTCFYQPLFVIKRGLKIVKTDHCLCRDFLSVRPSTLKTRLSADGFSRYLTCEYFLKIRGENSSSIKIWQE